MEDRLHRGDVAEAKQPAVLLAAVRGLSQDNDGNSISTCLDLLLLP